MRQLRHQLELAREERHQRRIEAAYAELMPLMETLRDAVYHYLITMEIDMRDELLDSFAQLGAADQQYKSVKAHSYLWSEDLIESVGLFNDHIHNARVACGRAHLAALNNDPELSLPDPMEYQARIRSEVESAGAAIKASRQAIRRALSGGSLSVDYDGM